jgi:hypothetical protein
MISAQGKIKPASANLLEVFRERCWARAMLVREGLATLQDSVDALQNAAVAYGLVPDDRAQDEIQAILEEAFAIVHAGDDERYLLQRQAADVARMIERWEAADGKRPHAAPVQKSPYRIPQSTIDAFWYVVRQGSADDVRRWLVRHPIEAPHLRKLWEAKKNGHR